MLTRSELASREDACPAKDVGHSCYHWRSRSLPRDSHPHLVLTDVPPDASPQMRGVAVIVLMLALLLPLLAISLLAVLSFERLVLARILAVSRWLGLPGRKMS